MILHMRSALYLMVVLTLLTGLIYPWMVTAIAELCFPWKANGSLILQDETWIGSALIGQSFTTPNYFWGRPSATLPFPYNGIESGGSNHGTQNPRLLTAVQQRVMQLSGSSVDKVPVDLVTASGSGLDPDISPLAAYYQVSRIAKVRQMSEQVLMDLIKSQTIPRTLGMLGEPSVNVLRLNQALDNLDDHHGQKSNP